MSLIIPSRLELDSVQTHLNLVQDVIRRMAVNSRSCKVWCVTLVAATLVLVARTGEPNHALIALVPATMFLVLDAYYLAQELRFRKSYKSFVVKLHSGELDSSQIYRIDTKRIRFKHGLRGVCSPSIYLFYPMLVVMILVVWRLIIPSSNNTCW